MSDKETMLMSRAYTHPLGKLTSPVRTMVPERVEAKLVETAIELGMNEAELVRTILCNWAFPDDMKRLEEERRQVISGNWSQQGHQKD